MNTESLNLISRYMFNLNPCDKNKYLQAGTGKIMCPFLKEAVLDVYHLQNIQRGNKSSYDINQRDIQIIDVLPTLVQSPYFFERLNQHAQYFLKDLEYEIDASKETRVALGNLKKVGSLKKLTDIGNFFELILDKNDNKKTITDDEKTVFRFLLTGLLKMDPIIDVSKSAGYLKLLLRYFHSDKSDKPGELYSCVLSKGFRLGRLINDLWGVKKTEKPGRQKIDFTVISYNQGGRIGFTSVLISALLNDIGQPKKLIFRPCCNFK